MAEEKHIIEPQRMGLWIAAAFILALLALVLSLVNMQRTKEVFYATQTQVLLLNKKIEDLSKGDTAPPAPAQ